MNCLRPTLPENDEKASMTEDEQAERYQLQHHAPLAFTSSSTSLLTAANSKHNNNNNTKASTLSSSSSQPSSLVVATSRIVVPVRVLSPTIKQWQWIFLNVEVFEHNTHEQSMLVFYIPGICESAETKSVQQMAQWAATIGVKLAVLELQGHGLSSGQLPDMSTDLEVLIGQVLLAIKYTTTKLLEDAPKTSFVVSGSSLGGTLALYAAEYMSRRRQIDLSHDDDDDDNGQNDGSLLYAQDLWKDFFQHGRMAGVVAITPAVGVDPAALPPKWMVSTLSFFSSWAPKAQVPVTPMEDSSHYNCPKTTQRNFSGNWPLITSKFLLDLTSKIVPNDIKTQQLTLRGIPRVVIVAGAKDSMIPIEALQALEANIVAPSKELLVLPKAGHDVLLNPKSSGEALEHVFATLLHTKNSKHQMNSGNK